MNTKSTYFIYAAVLFLVLAGCSAKKETAENTDAETHAHDEAKSEKWEIMDEFHMIMAESFHPYKDSANLAPAKANAVAMAAAAEKWQSSPLPEKVNNDEVKAKLEELKKNTASFVETVKAGDDKVIAESLTKLHDLFHELQESWYGGEHHHH